MQHAGIIHEHIELAKMPRGSRDDAVYILFAADVTGQYKSTAIDFLSDFLQTIFAAAHQGNLSAFACESDGTSPSNTCSCTRNNGCFVFEARHA
jgi:hypothetical protein